MDEKQSLDPPVSGLPIESTTEPIADPILKPETIKPELVRERAESVDSASLSDAEKSASRDGQASVMPPDRPANLSRQVSEAPSEYPGPKKVAAVMVAILLSVFLMSLDRTIIATAIPSITDEFNSLQDIGWYASAFMLTACCFQLLLGRIYTFYPPKYVFLVLIGIFEVGSAICGAAPNSISFIIGRAIAGIGSAGIMSGAIILMVSIIPLAKRPLYQGFFGAVFGVSSVIGPLLGGAFTTDVSWRWCFYINLPIGGVSMIAIVFLLKPTTPQNPGLTILQQLGQLDLLGELFLLPSIICLLLALQWGGSTYAFSNWRIILLFTIFAVTLVAFGVVQVLFQKTATIPVRVIKNRSIIAGMWFTICLASCMMINVYYLSIWFQAIKGTSAVQSGIDTIPMVLALVVGSIASGQLVGRIGYYTPLALAGAVIMPIGAGLIYTFNLDTNSGKWIGYQILLGIGIGVSMQQGTMGAQTVLSKLDVPIGVSLMFFMQQLGGAIFVSVGQNVFNQKLISGLTKLVPNLSVSQIINTGATDLRHLVSDPSDLHKVLVAYNGAIRQVFLVAVCTAALSFLGAASLEWRSVKGRQGPSAKPKPDTPGADAEKASDAPVEVSYASEKKEAEQV